jgi:hypothetical protein
MASIKAPMDTERPFDLSCGLSLFKNATSDLGEQNEPPQACQHYYYAGVEHGQRRDSLFQPPACQLPA